MLRWIRWRSTRKACAGGRRNSTTTACREKTSSTFCAATAASATDLIGDLNAQIAAGRTGEQRLRALFERFGKAVVLAARDAIFEQTGERERRAIRGISNGRYQSQGWLDDDGLDSGPVPVRVTAIVNDESITIDLEGSGAQTRGPVNCGFTQTIAAARVAFKLLVRSDDPVNGGSFLTLEVRAPEHTMFNAREPAPCAWYFSSLGLLIDLVVKALAPVMPNEAAGAHYGDSMVVTIAGEDPRRDGQRYLMVEPTTGGWGGFEGGDGADSLINNVNGNFKDLPVEIFENKYPVLIESYGIRTDSGGAGRFRGGNGTCRRYRLRADASLSLWFERSVTSAWGLFGGDSGSVPEVVIEEPGREPVRCLKVNSLPLAAGTVITSHTGGGGGYGAAAERDPEAVRQDLIDGLVSPAFGKLTYGITCPLPE